jgi:adenylate kinase
MSRILIVAGSPGSGKTTLLSSRAIRSKYKVVTMGDLMAKAAIAKGLVRNRDEIRRLPIAANKRISAAAAREIARIGGNIVLETHASVEADGRFIPGLLAEHMRVWGNVVGLVYLDSTNEEIIRRRMRDRSRIREHESAEWLDRQRIVNLAALSYHSASLNIPLYIIDNRQGKMNASVKEFIAHAKDAFGAI